MSGIAGIAERDKKKEVQQMLDKISHRGRAGSRIIETEGATLGVVWTEPQSDAEVLLKEKHIAKDEAGKGQFAQAEVTDDGVILTRDPIGVAPLYYGHTKNGDLSFASEVKAMLEVTDDVNKLPAGSRYDGKKIESYFQLQEQSPINDSSDDVAKELHRRLDQSVRSNIDDGDVGSWLSGGLDSSTMSALASKYVDKLNTFAVGLSGSSDVEYAREVADFIGSKHHELIVNTDALLKALPEVIYHLESFDALLVRSSITNYMVAKLASDHVPKVFSGEGGDELFAGYSYLKELDQSELPGELIDITNRLHDTALQRVDRCASAHGTVAYVGFLDPDVVDYAVRIPIEYKLNNGVEKWILRKAMDGMLPKRVLDRPKAKFWEGAGVGDILSQYADEKISDTEFNSERNLPNGWVINTKEELFYYRIFREIFGDLDNLSWMGRTKGAPKQ